MPCITAGHTLSKQSIKQNMIVLIFWDAVPEISAFNLKFGAFNSIHTAVVFSGFLIGQG